MQDRKKLLLVGDVAEIANISKKQLRHYDQLGVFCPAYKDPNTGYRYYTEDQLREIFLVRDLRFMGMSMNQIADILVNSQNIYDICEEMELHQRQLLLEIATAQHKLSQVNIQLARMREALHCKSMRSVQRTYVKPFHAVSRKMKWDPFREGYRVSSWEFSDLLTESREKRLDASDNFIIMQGDYMAQFDKQKTNCPMDVVFGWMIQPGTFPVDLESFGGFEAISLPSFGTDETKEGDYRQLIRYAEENNLELEEYCMERHILGSSFARGYDKQVIMIYLPIKNRNPEA